MSDPAVILYEQLQEPQSYESVVWAAAMTEQLDFVPEVVGSYWRTYRGTAVQLDVVAVAPREKRLLNFVGSA